mmetsp:Transcript_71833/g.164730  ORF Transcript_71833/g.164730 Transcript_71833/m.164730 type:complete len:122 (-) Transcript_71833:57-422(-)
MCYGPPLSLPVLLLTVGQTALKVGQTACSNMKVSIALSLFFLLLKLGQTASIVARVACMALIIDCAALGYAVTKLKVCCSVHVSEQSAECVGMRKGIENLRCSSAVWATSFLQHGVRAVSA